MFALPFVAALVRLFFDDSPLNANAFLTSIFGVATVLGAASTFRILRDSIIPLLSSCISLSAIVALVQKFVFLDKGIVPWLEYYDVPGYASVAGNAQTIALYIRRPFGLFPEPSFLAGSLALATVALIASISVFKQRYSALSVMAFSLSIFTIYVSDSGSGIVCIVVLAAVAFIPIIRRFKGLLLLLPFVLAGAVWLGLSIAANRQSGVNTSWNDRMASIIGASRLILEEPNMFLFGLGRGMIPSYFESGRVSFADMTVYSSIPDVYSVLVRIVLENGIVFGLPIVVWMVLLITTEGTSRITPSGVLYFVLWFVVAALTISYETAAWIWILPGIFLGRRSIISISKNESTEYHFEDTSHSQ